MTETYGSVPNATTTENKPDLVFKDEMHQMQFKMLSDFITKRNSLVGQANAAAGNKEDLIAQVRENDSDPAIVQARETWAKAYEDLMALVSPKVEAIIANSQGSVEKIEAEIKEIDSALKPGLTYFKKIYGEESASHFPSQDRLKGTQVRSGGGGRRIRGYNVQVTVDGETKEFQNFSTAAQYLDVDTLDLQNAFFAKAGTTVLKDIADVISLVVNFDEVDEDGNKTEKEALVKAYRTEPTGNSASDKPSEPADVDSSEDETDESAATDADDEDLEAL